MLQAKYKAHRLVNIIFYLIVFLIGFYLGSLGKSINIKNLLNKYLFIDNVYALEENTYNYPDSYTPAPSFGSNGTYKNEQYIYNLFTYFVDYYDLSISFNQFSHVMTYGKQNVAGTQIVWYFSSSSFSGTTSEFTTGDVFYITYTSSSNPPYKWVIHTSSDIHVYNNIYSGTYSNQSGFGTSSLDFSNYYSLEFNPYLFDNFSNFKEVCINPHKPFVVSSNTIVDNNKTQIDYLWFGGKLTNLNKASLDNSGSITSFESFTLDSSFFGSVSDIIKSDSILSNSNTTSYSSIGNINYYGWTAIPFQLWFIPSGSIDVENGNLVPNIGYMTFDFLNNVYPIYKFDNDFTITIYHTNGVSRSYIDLSNSANDDLQICFYVNDIYDITNIDVDINGFYTGTIPTPNGDIEIYVDGINYNYFENFRTNTYGLSSVITAPLVAIRSIANGTCTPQVINILNKTITLPCGDTLFWGREDVQTFKFFWNMFFGGVLCYGIGISLFKSIKNFRDPDNDKVEVIDL